MTSSNQTIVTAFRNRAGQVFGGLLPQPALQDADWPVMTQVLAYWEDLRRGRLAPSRAEIDPAAVAGALEFMFMAELVAPGVARLRLAGQHMANLMGMEPRGMPLSVYLDASARLELDQALRQVADGARAVLPLRAATGLGQPGLDGVLALMPLTDADGKITRVLGVLETCGQIGRAPRQFRPAGPLRPAADAPAPTGRRIGAFTVIEGGRT